LGTIRERKKVKKLAAKSTRKAEVTLFQIMRNTLTPK